MFDEKKLKQNNNFKRKDLIEITDVNIDTKLDYDTRIKNYLEQIKNPYCFLCNDVIVTISFSEKGEEHSELLKKYMNRQ